MTLGSFITISMKQVKKFSFKENIRKVSNRRYCAEGTNLTEKYFGNTKNSNKDTKKTSLTSFWCLSC